MSEDPKQESTFYPILEKFIHQGQTTSLKREGYPTSYKGLDTRVSFGSGNLARIPWIAFLRAPNTVTHGIYPVLLYYKSDSILILSYGVSETNESLNRWQLGTNAQTISTWFMMNKGKKPERYGDSYVKSVYYLGNINPEVLQTDLDDLINEYKELKFPEEENEQLMLFGKQIPRVWLIATGEGASLWDEFNTKGIVGVGWDNVGDLNNYASREAIADKLIVEYPDGSPTQKNNSLCLWQFSHEMKIGDIIIAKKGQTEYLGYGIVASEYYFDNTRNHYKNLRKVEWMKKGLWKENAVQIVMKTLTDITKYPEYVDRLKRLIGIEQEASVDIGNIEYYWLNANPKYWRIEDFEVGHQQSYTTHNEKGNKRNRFEYFQKIKPGDLVIGYETSPILKVVAIFEVTQGAFIDEDTGVEKISFKIQKFLPNPISYQTLRNIPELNNSEVMKSNQGSLFRLTKEEFDAIVEMDITAETNIPLYSIQTAENEMFLEAEKIKEILDNLEYKKNIILQGPPGVGKTFIAKRLAYLMLEVKDNTKIEMVQFHQSYSYEDFVQGYRPKDDGSFKLENGVFYRFCKKAQADPENKYFFIIDEINRGNLSKIFGELLLLIESDKRGAEFGVSLTYTSANENKFYIPNNVFLIGTMNTADRSLALVDYALRRRFAFINITPTFNEKFKQELINSGVDEGIINIITAKFTQLNSEIERDSSLGAGFCIGHSYFCNVPKNSGDEDWYNSIIKHEIAPLLLEYWFDNIDKSDTQISRLFHNAS